MKSIHYFRAMICPILPAMLLWTHAKIQNDDDVWSRLSVNVLLKNNRSWYALISNLRLYRHLPQCHQNHPHVALNLKDFQGQIAAAINANAGAQHNASPPNQSAIKTGEIKHHGKPLFQRSSTIGHVLSWDDQYKLTNIPVNTIPTIARVRIRKGFS